MYLTMVSPVYTLLQSSSSMAAINAHSISKLPLPLSQFSTQTHFSKFNSSSFISHNSFPSSITTTTTTHLFLNSTKQRHVSAVVSFSLPTTNPESAVAEKLPKWSWRAIKSFAMGELEARKLKYATTGTEAILMGILVEGTSLASKYLWDNGITLFKVRDESIKLLGKGDFYYFSPEHPPLTESAQKALDRALDVKLKSEKRALDTAHCVDEEITPTELLLGIWSEVESPGHKILAALGFDDEKAKELQALSSKPGFDEQCLHHFLSHYNLDLNMSALIPFPRTKQATAPIMNPAKSPWSPSLSLKLNTIASGSATSGPHQLLAATVANTPKHPEMAASPRDTLTDHDAVLAWFEPNSFDTRVDPQTEREIDMEYNK
ncbi:hypothetical protein KSS87_014330 [Heliosperma pusillum]|nr:hypothetical protein KSS87_014330 [Heliosperma pusillum]